MERKIPNFPGVLPEFFYLVDPKFRGPEPACSTWLFPRAVEMPGWMHQFDLLIRRGLSSLSFFPGWVDLMKALISFLRQSQHITSVSYTHLTLPTIYSV